MGLFDKLGIGSGRSFYTRDFRNAYHLRPDVNPPRQKFQGYVNFILNRDLFSSLYAGTGLGPLDSAAFRNTISSLVRRASIPDITFKTETKNSYNRRKVIHTGIDFPPVNIVVMDTVGNEWLSLLMNYYSYHYMNPRNKSKASEGQEFPDRNIIRPAETSTKNTNSAFKLNKELASSADVETGFDSNAYGYNVNTIPNFFERIDYILYHGNKAVQYSLMNPTLTAIKTADLDYASSDILEYDLTFEYENFVPYSSTNFTLTDVDVARFEQGFKFEGPAFVPAKKPLSIDEDSAPTRLTFLGGAGGAQDPSSSEIRMETGRRSRAAQPLPSGQTSSNALENPPLAIAGDTQPLVSPSGAAIEGSSTSDVAAEASADPVAKSTLPDVYGNSAKFADAVQKTKGESFLENLLGNVAGAAVGAALNGGNLKNAVVGSIVGTVSSEISKTANNIARPSKPSAPQSIPNPAPPQQTP